jgi:hypothetical protein
MPTLRKVLFAFTALLFSANVFGQELVVDLKELRTVVDRWANAHNTKNIHQFRELYADDLMFYGQSLDRESCLDIKSKRLLSNKYFHLKIVSPITVTVYSSQVIKAGFMKEVTSGNTIKDYNSYLLFRIIDNKLLIVSESDLTTDSQTGFTADLGKELRQSRLPDNTSIPNDSLTPETQSTTSNNLFRNHNFQLSLFIGVPLIFAGVWLFIYRVRSAKEKPDKRVGPETKYTIGYTFEQFIANRFPKEYFQVLDWRSDKGTNGIYPTSNKHPDLEMEFKNAGTKIKFAVECKFRTILFNGLFEIDQRQLNNYIEFQKSRSIQVYIALGLGGTADNPTDLFLVPLEVFRKKRVISYNVLCDYYDDPKFKFYYDAQKGGLRTSYKKQNDWGYRGRLSL